MTHQSDSKKKIVFLFSDTGGGHRSSAEAIIEALELEYPSAFDTKMVDIFRDYAPMPLDQAPELYPQMTSNPRFWKAGYSISNGKRKAELFTQVAWPYIRQSIIRLVNENPCDLFVSVHPFSNRAILNVTKNRRIPFVTIVTDMVSVHAFWFDARADLIVVPTEAAKQRGLEFGIPEPKIVVAGQPVAERFCLPRQDKLTLRKQLNWPVDLPVILLVGGGEGMGPLEKIAHAIDDAQLRATLVIIAGRNQSLQDNLEKRRWNIPVRIYGFVHEMPEFMAAADILATKAGPGTISEAFIAGLPIILYNRLPGQEDGNVVYVVENKAGVWAPDPQQVVDTLEQWLSKPDLLTDVSTASQNLARPQATRQIARLLVHQMFSIPESPLLLPSKI